MTMTEIPPRLRSSLSQAESLILSAPPELRAEVITEFVNSLPPSQAEALPYAWSFWRRPAQVQPENYRLWIVRAGRGFGKNRTLSETVRENVRAGRWGRMVIIGQSPSAVRNVIIEGESGILAVHPPDWRPTYEPSKRLLTWPNGATALCFSAANPEELRGPQSDAVLGDEPGSWQFGQTAWDNAMFGNRLGRHPQAMLIGTPRRLKWLQEQETKPGAVVTRGSTYDNLANLPPDFIAMIIDSYAGTRLGRQEIHAEYIEDVDGALWTTLVIDAGRIAAFDPTSPWASLAAGVSETQRATLGLGPLRFENTTRSWQTWVGVDPPGETAECGIVTATAPTHGRAAQDHAVVLADDSIAGTPEQWGARVVAAVHRWSAAGVVVESNQGGDMVRSTIHNIDPNVKVVKIRAVDSKHARAEPVSVLYAKGWVHHLGNLATLESQMTTWVPGDKSPDRLDALAHVITHLLPPRPRSASSGIGSPTRRRR